MEKETINSLINEATILGAFKKMCILYDDSLSKILLKKIIDNSQDLPTTITILFSNKLNFKFNSKDDISRMIMLIKAFLAKSNYRREIDIATRTALLNKQLYKCAICDKQIDLSSHADHIVPFKYVGDELADNLQMLCPHCNEVKNESIDYQIKYYLNLL